MQDPATFPAMKPPFPEQEQLKCPRCDSTNTKFCYYNNYNLSQPRHFCKNCRRYWTKGGALRNIPIGGGTRKNSKRSSNPKSHHRTSSPSSSSSSSRNPPPPPPQQPKSEPTGVGPYAPSPEIERDRRMMEVPGSFSSLLASSGQFGHFFEGLNPGGGSGTVDLGGFAEADTGRVGDPVLELQSTGNAESFLGFQPGNGGGGGDSSCWGGGGGGGGGAGNGWPDLSIYTPGSTYQ